MGEGGLFFRAFSMFGGGVAGGKGVPYPSHCGIQGVTERTLSSGQANMARVRQSRSYRAESLERFRGEAGGRHR